MILERIILPEPSYCCSIRPRRRPYGKRSDPRPRSSSVVERVLVTADEEETVQQCKGVARDGEGNNSGIVWGVHCLVVGTFLRLVTARGRVEAAGEVFERAPP